MQKDCLIDRENHKILIGCEPTTKEERDNYTYEKECENFVQIVSDYIKATKENACFFVSNTFPKETTPEKKKKEIADILKSDTLLAAVDSEKAIEGEKENTVLATVKYSEKTAKELFMRRENLYIGDSFLQEKLLNLDASKVKMLHFAHFPVMQEFLDAYFKVGNSLICSNFSSEWSSICIYYKENAFDIDALLSVLPKEYAVMEM